MTPPVIIYTTTWCGFCRMAKKYMDGLGIKYEEKDVERDQVAATEAVQKSGQMGVPVIDVNGTIILGFDRAHLDQAFRMNNLV
jgi:glutaredoxin 3